MGWKSKILHIANRFGYDIVRHYAGDDRDSEYMWCNPYPYRTFAPWNTRDFKELYKKVSNNTVVTRDRCYILHQLALHSRNLPGEFAECGVYKGGTAFLVADAIKESGKKLYLFDTFSGMPKGAEKDPSGHRSGDFGDTSLDAVKDYLSAFDFIRFIQGIIPKTFSAVDSCSYCFVHIDVDLYQSVYDCCYFFYERLVPGGVMIFDDYGFVKYIHSAKKAVDELFSDKLEVPFSLHTGQCIVFKLAKSNY